MEKTKIISFGDPVLREKAHLVLVFHKKLHTLIDTMKFTLLNRDDGAALAANQISVLKRIVVINYLGEYHEMVNPEIFDFSGEQTGYEGCLSFPGFSGKVKRAYTIKVAFQDRYGNEKTMECSGQMAVCIQHEVDHLDGILYIDRMDEEFLFNDEDNRMLPVIELSKITPQKTGMVLGL